MKYILKSVEAHDCEPRSATGRILADGRGIWGDGVPPEMEGAIWEAGAEFTELW